MYLLRALGHQAMPWKSWFSVAPATASYAASARPIPRPQLLQSIARPVCSAARELLANVPHASLQGCRSPQTDDRSKGMDIASRCARPGAFPLSHAPLDDAPGR